MAKIYIAGPMGTFAKAAPYAVAASQLEGELIAQGHQIYNPYASCLHPGNFEMDKELWLANDRYWISQCDRIVLLPGWEQSEGSRAEIEFAKANGIEVDYEYAKRTAQRGLFAQGDEQPEEAQP